MDYFVELDGTIRWQPDDYPAKIYEAHADDLFRGGDTEYTVRENSLLVKGKRIDFPDPIEQVAETADGLVILTYWNCPRNVFFVRPDGTLRWQIEEAPDKVRGAAAPAFTGISVDPDGTLRAGTDIGAEYEVNLADGSLRRPSGLNRLW